MDTLQALLIDIGRIGMGAVYLFSIVLDYKMRSQVFDMMARKKVSMPKLCFIGADIWKAATSIALIVNFHTFWAALLLALFIFMANVVFNNFWAIPKEQRGFPLVMFMTHLAVCFGLLVIAVS